MKNHQIMIILIMIFGMIFYNIILVFEMPESMMGWVMSDIILTLYLSYLIDTFIRGSKKPNMS
ncbi:hypothetical protein ABF87_05555 [Nitrosomonas sp. JL21]|nr:hypothetical protein [Nitrosomonas sp. JL21]